MPLPTTPQKPTSVQPGGGTCMAIELAWARFRKFWLRKLRPGYVQAMQAKRQGECANCPHDIIDARDLKFTRNVCGYSFRPEDDLYAYRNRLPFARHGFAELLLFSLVYLILAGACVWAGLAIHWLFWILVAGLSLVELEIVTFFRDPERVIPADTESLVSPADGRVTHVEEVEEPEFGKALRISIFLSIFNVHVNRCPFDVEVVDVRYFPGEYLDARNSDSAVRNEQLWIDLLDPATRRPMRVKQISGAIARRIVCWLKPGDLVKKGERIGMIKLGSRTDLLIPSGSAAEVCVKVGDAVKGGATILLKFAHNHPPTNS
ncbi:MAG: phosphatidylserine decarboxylase family protein [Planctomycetes bacterium]|nr:phosphatidylserine decarboxylase family protein [Planctomycetota bacterium]